MLPQIRLCMIEKIGKYKIERELASGGFGRVYRGLDEAVGRPVAVKVLTAAADESTLARFSQEAAAAGNLHHPNIVTLYEFGNHEGTPFLAMEFLEGRNLQQLIESKTALTMLDKLRVLRQVAEGLEHAHRCGVVHRDVKPSNIMLLPDGVVKIMDFGIARVARQSGMRLTHMGDLIGTLLYMSPEQFRNTDSDAISDIFAVGIVAYELISGVHPFYAEDTAALMYRVTNEDPKPVCQGVPDCPPEIESIICRALAKDRHLRYQTLRDLIYDLEPLVRQWEQQEADRLLGRAEALFASGNLPGSEAVLGEVLALNPANAAARSLRATIQARELQSRVTAAVARGKEHLGARHWAEAAQEFGLGARLGNGVDEASLLLAAAKAEMERVQRASALLDEARRLSALGESTRAVSLAEQAVLLDPDAEGAETFLSKAREELARKQAGAELRSLVTKARGLSLIGELDRAKALLDELPPHAAEERFVAELRTRVDELRQVRDRRREAEAALNKARGLIHEERFDEAVATLETPAAADPQCAAEREHLLRSVRQKIQERQRQQERALLAAEVETFLAGQDFEAACQKLEAALFAEPGDPEWDALLSSVIAGQMADQDRIAREAELRKCDHLAAQGDIVLATGRAEAARLRWPGAPEFPLLLQRLLPAYEKHLREEEAAHAVAWARKQLALERPHVANAIVGAALNRLPDHPGAIVLSAEIEALLEQRHSPAIATAPLFQKSQLRPDPPMEPKPALPSPPPEANPVLETVPAVNNLLERATHVIRGFFR